jgi:hypothetical protein
VTIRDGFRTYFTAHGLDFDYVLFSYYERQVQAVRRPDHRGMELALGLAARREHRRGGRKARPGG